MRYKILLLMASFALGVWGKLVPGVEAVDFDTLNEADGKKTQRVYVTNDGSEPVVITRIQTTCGCTAADYYKDEIKPGQSAWLDVTYDPAHKIGRFEKHLKIFTNDGELLRLPVVGSVKSTEETIKSRYPYAAGPLRLSEKKIISSPVGLGDQKALYVYFYNDSDTTLHPAVESDSPVVTATIGPAEVEPSEIGGIAIFINTLASHDTGRCQYEVKLNPDINNPESRPDIIEIVVDIYGTSRE